MAILDSGNRMVFESGAVRDMRAGKGRCDLIPLDVAGALFDEPEVTMISNFCRTGDVMHLLNALFAFAENYAGGTAEMMLEVAIQYEEGVEKYGENNWKKGIPIWCYIDSALRHYWKWMMGQNDERHDRAFVWNIMGAIWTVWEGERVEGGKKEREGEVG